MTSKYTDFFKDTIGIENILDLHRRMTENMPPIKPSFPFYNIKREGNKYQLEFAVAGYTISDIEIELDKNTLTVSSKGIQEDDDKLYSFRGFTKKAFKRQFTIDDSIKVENAELLNGILRIYLDKFVPEESKPKKINISQPTAAKNPQLLNEESAF